MVKGRKLKDGRKNGCSSCNRKGKNLDGMKMYELYIGYGHQGHSFIMCEACMHELTVKLIKLGTNHDVQ